MGESGQGVRPEVFIRPGDVFRPPDGSPWPAEVRPEWAPSAWDALVWRVAEEPAWRERVREILGPLLRKTFDHPEERDLAVAVRECFVLPEDLREAVARRFENRAPGRPRKGETRADLAEALLACPGIEPGAAAYVAGRLRKTIGPPRGQPEEDPLSGDGFEEWAFLRVRLRVLHAAFRLQGVRAPKEEALLVLSRQEHRTPETLAREPRRSPFASLARLRHPQAAPLPWEAPLATFEARVRAWVGSGKARLDRREGLRFPPF